MSHPSEINLEQQAPEWIVNDLGELGVKVGGRFFFLYKGDNIEYESGMHDDGTPMMWRPVGKREFGETCWPLQWVLAGRRERRYTQELNYSPGLSYGAPGDCDWRPLLTSAPEQSCTFTSGDGSHPLAPAPEPSEGQLRAEFERQHKGRNLLRHRLRGTYSSPPIAALWNQHLKTAKWCAVLAVAATE